MNTIKEEFIGFEYPFEDMLNIDLKDEETNNVIKKESLPVYETEFVDVDEFDNKEVPKKTFDNNEVLKKKLNKDAHSLKSRRKLENISKVTTEKNSKDDHTTKRVKRSAYNRISVAKKIEIVKKIDEGIGLSEIAKSLQLAKSTVHNIIKNKEKIKLTAQCISSKAAAETVRNRNHAILMTESILNTWIINQRDQGTALSEKIIKTKALSLFENMKAERGIEGSFLASNGWYSNFKQRYKLRNVLSSGEITNEVCQVASTFIAAFEHKVQDGGYNPKQVFNIDETGLCWKKLPSHTCIPHEDKGAPEFKASDDRLTLLLGGNAAGDVKLKPLLIFKSNNPSSIKNVNESELPVIWCSNEKAWVTKTIFSQWFNNYFVPFVDHYNKSKNLPNKALLVIDSAPAHPPDINNKYPHIKVIFMPPNTTSSIQPMEQGIISLFKAYYLQEVMKLILESTSKTEEGIQRFWKKFNIHQALGIIECCWNNITKKMMNGVWKKLWPTCILAKYDDTRIVQDACNKKSLELSCQLGLADLTMDDITEYMNDEAEFESVIDDIEPSVDESLQEQENLKDFLDTAEILKDKMLTVELDEENRLRFRFILDNLMNSYKSKYEQNIVQN